MEAPIRIRYPQKLAGKSTTSYDLPPACRYKIPFATPIQTRNDLGSFLSQSVSGSDYWMVLWSFSVITECYIDLVIGTPFIAISMFIKGDLAAEIIGNGFATAPRGSFNLFYMPAGIQRLPLPKGECVLLCIIPPNYYLSSMAEEHKGINELMAKLTSHDNAGAALKSFAIPQGIWRIIKRLEKTNKKGSALDIELRRYILEILGLYNEQFKEQTKKEVLYASSMQKAQAVKEYILENLGDQNLGGLNEFAHRYHISTKPLTREFKILTGKTIPQFITDARLELARQLLAKKQMRVFEIALLVGFSDTANFIRKFKKKFGYPPKKQSD